MPLNCADHRQYHGSKKSAETLDALVLDVKFGSGAFMRTFAETQQLADSLMQTGTNACTRCTVLSDMNQPLGCMVGNVGEVNESLEVLREGGPADVRELTLALCAELLVQVGRSANKHEAFQQLANKLDDGAGLAAFPANGRSSGWTIRRPVALVQCSECVNPQAGTVTAINGQLIGRAVIELGGGRKKLVSDSTIKLAWKCSLIREKLERGAVLARVFAHDHTSKVAAAHRIQAAIQIE